VSFHVNHAQNEAALKFVQMVFSITMLLSFQSDRALNTGALTSGKGSRLVTKSLENPPTDDRSRFILANTEQLHAKIIQMSDRIRQLEDALETVQAKCSSDPHPLLHQDSLRIKNSLELYSSHATSGRHSQMDGTIKENYTSNLQLPVASSSIRDADKFQDSRLEVICSIPNLQGGR
jgi:hypothetical protein